MLFSANVAFEQGVIVAVIRIALLYLHGSDVHRHSFNRSRVATLYGAPFVKILYLTDLAQKLLSLRAFSYLCAHLAISAQR